MNYFSQREFRAFISGTVCRVKLSWLALAGEILSGKDTQELSILIEKFLRERGHRSFRKHHAQ
jgi:hypothetical protein